VLEELSGWRGKIKIRGIVSAGATDYSKADRDRSTANAGQGLGVRKVPRTENREIANRLRSWIGKIKIIEM